MAGYIFYNRTAMTSDPYGEGEGLVNALSWLMPSVFPYVPWFPPTCMNVDMVVKIFWKLVKMTTIN